MSKSQVIVNVCVKMITVLFYKINTLLDVLYINYQVAGTTKKHATVYPMI